MASGITQVQSGRVMRETAPAASADQSDGTGRANAEEGAPRNPASVPELDSGRAYCLKTREPSELVKGVPGIQPKHSRLATRMMSFCNGDEILDQGHLRDLIPQDGSLSELQRAYAAIYGAPLEGLKHDLLYAARDRTELGLDNNELRQKIEDLFVSAPRYKPRQTSRVGFRAFRSSYQYLDLTPLEEAMTRADSAQGINIDGLREHYGLIDQNAQKFGLDPLLVVSLMRYESNFNPKAKSDKGAIGLMQIMPETARDIDGEGAAARLTEPATSIRLGCEYLAFLWAEIEQAMDRVGYSTPLTDEQACKLSVIGYNAGPGRIGPILAKLRSGQINEALAGISESDELAANVWSMYQALRQVRDNGQQMEVGTH